MNEAIRADERDQMAAMLTAWAESLRHPHMTEYENGYMQGFRKAARLVAGDEE